MQIGRQLGVGLGRVGDLLPGTFAIPDNPIRDAGTALVPSALAVVPQGYRVKSMGELLPGKFAEPENPIRRALLYGYTGAPTGMGCGCGGSCGCGKGMGALDLTGVETWLTESSVAGIPNWGLLGIGLVGAYFLLAPGGSAYKDKSSALRSQYRGYKRVARAVA